MAVSWARAASTRGSNWAASATMKRVAGIGHGRTPDLGRDLHGTAAAGGPAAGHHAAHHVFGVETAVVNPLLQPVPAIGGEKPAELSVGQQGLNGRMLELHQFPASGGFGVDSGPVQGPHQVLRGVGVQRRRVEGGAQFPCQGLHFFRVGVDGWFRSEQFMQQPPMQVLPPGDTFILHLRSHQSTGRFGTEQKCEPGRGVWMN